MEAIPAWVAYAAVAASAVSAGISYAGARRQARAQEDISAWNAQQAKAKAEQAKLDAVEASKRSREEKARFFARQRAAVAGAGFTETGTTIDLLATTASELELQIQEQWRAMNVERENLYAAAAVGQWMGREQASATRLAATGSLLEGASSLASSGMSTYRTFGKPWGKK